MPKPYETPIQTGLVVPGGTSVCFPIPFPNRVRLLKLIVQQVDGAPAVDFTVDLYSAMAACADAIADSGLEVLPIAGVVDAMYHVGQAGLTSDTAGHLEFYFKDQDVYFYNRDPPGNSIGASRTIYVKINAQGTGNKTFALILSCEIQD